VSVEDVLLELGLVLAVEELAVLEGDEDWSAYVPLVPCAVLLLEVGLVEAVVLEAPVVSVLEVGLVAEAEDWSVLLWPVLPKVELLVPLVEPVDWLFWP